MTWLVAFAALALFGLVTWRLDCVRAMPLDARLALALSSGIVLATSVMWAYTLVGIPWTRLSLLVALIPFAVATRVHSRSTTHTAQPVASIATGALLLITLYGLATARETCADLIYFWGPKGQRFWLAGGVDPSFLGFPHYALMHPDYPPLPPSAYAFASLFAQGFSPWGAIFTTVLLLAASAAVLRGFMGATPRSSWYALLLTAVLAQTYAAAMVAGGADPMLLLFEITALCALTFGGGSGRGANVVAAIALAGAAMSKVEGAAFVGVVLIALLILRRGLTRALATALPAALLLGSWIAWCARQGLLEAYRRGGQPAHWSTAGSVAIITLRSAGYGAFYLPWLAAAAPLPFGRNWRRAALPLLMAAGSVAYTLFFYLHPGPAVAAPAWWIEASAGRVLLTPLACLVVAAAAATE
jgi:hypothetical protein